MKNLCFGFMLLLSIVACRGGGIEWGGAQWGGGWGWGAEIPGEMDAYDGPNCLNIITREYGWSTLTPVNILITTTSGQAILTNTKDNDWIAFGGLFLETSYGTFIDRNFFLDALGSGDPFFQRYTYPSSGEYINSDAPLVIKNGETLLLAFVIGVFNDSYDDFYYGWIEFGYNGSTVTILNSALNTTFREGLFAGGGTIPEPASALLLLPGAALLLRRRRAKEHGLSSP